MIHSGAACYIAARVRPALIHCLQKPERLDAYPRMPAPRMPLMSVNTASLSLRSDVSTSQTII